VGDIVHFASVEFRVGHREAAGLEPAIGPDTTHYAVTAELPRHFVSCAAAFEQMLRQRAVVPYYQPIVRLVDARTVAFEVLGRGALEGVPSSTGELWAVAHSLGQEVELSELFRQTGVQQAQALGDGWQLFVNSDPAEMNLRYLERSLNGLRRMAPGLAVVLEINERAVTDVGMMRSLRALLDGLGMGLAYDDFGAGQARLVELIEVPPDYLKFDIVLVRNLDRQPPRAQQALQALVRMTRDLGISVLAEGVETRGEAESCLRLGFDLAQGFFFGRPAPLDHYLGATRPAAHGP
jgi:EAL domain-containing protein (putative c-di-GMP-specific phosphodiesterase class I)